MKRFNIMSALAAGFIALQFSAAVSADYDNEAVYFHDDDFEAVFSIELSEEETIRAIEGIDADYEICTENYAYKASLYDFSTDYYYNQLNEDGKALYDDLVQCCEELTASTVNITETTKSGRGLLGYAVYDADVFSYDELREVFYAFYYSNPQYYFLANGFAYGVRNSQNVVFPMVENEGPDFKLYSSRYEYQNKLSELTSLWMQEINSCCNEYEKEKLICEKLCDYITYTYSGIDQSVAGALVDKACVCNGYAMAVSYFCNAADIDCITVVSADHAWNRVKLYGKWYEVDTTWMDQESYILYDWFNKSSDTFADNDSNYMHTIDTAYYDSFFTLPECNADFVYFDEIAAPEFSSCTARGQKVTLAWNSVENADGYRIYRADSLVGEKTLMTETISNEYSDATVQEGSSYYYFAESYNMDRGLVSDYSDGVLAQMPIRPAKPVNVRTASGGGNVTITWNKANDATSYRVFRSETLTGTRYLARIRTSTFFVDTNVETGKEYYYWILAYNTNTGCISDFSSVSKVSVVADFPETIEIKDVSVLSTSVTLSWDIVPGATSYRIYRRNDDGSRKLICAQSMNQFKDSGLVKGKEYMYEIRAYSATTGAITNYSKLKHIRTMAAPTILKGNVKGKIEWDKNAVATSYRVYRADSINGTKILLAPTTQLKYTDTTAVKGQMYYYYVAAYDKSTDTLSAYSRFKAIRIA